MSNVPAKLILLSDWILILFWFNAWCFFVSFFCETTYDARKNLFMLFPRLVIPTKPPLISGFLFSCSPAWSTSFAIPGIWFIWTRKCPSQKNCPIFGFFSSNAHISDKLVAFCDSWFCPYCGDKMWFLQVYLDALTSFLIEKYS